MRNFDSLKKFTVNDTPEKPLVHRLDGSKLKVSKKTMTAIVGILFLGIFSGFLLARYTSRNIITTGITEKTEVSAKKIVGSLDTKTFRDSAEGTLEVGSIDGEGTHKLERPGGESQTVYLTSSVLDLGQFVGKKVRVWGETHAAKKAGWLMDVGKVEVL